MFSLRASMPSCSQPFDFAMERAGRAFGLSINLKKGNMSHNGVLVRFSNKTYVAIIVVLDSKSFYHHEFIVF